MKELVQYADFLRNSGFSPNFRALKDIDIAFTLGDCGLSKVASKKKGLGLDHIPLYETRMGASYVIGNDKNKCLDGHGLFMFTANPLCISFKPKKVEEKGLKKGKGEVVDRIEAYFKGFWDLWGVNENPFFDECQRLHQWCLEHLYETAIGLGEQYGLDKDSTAYIFMDAPDGAYRLYHDAYISKRAFLKREYTKSVRGQDYGVDYSLFTYNPRKPFITHNTFFSIKSRMTKDDTKKVLYVLSLIKAGILPNPLPLFVDGDINGECLKVLKDGGKMRYRDLMRSLDERGVEAGNYQLFWLNKKDSSVSDMDYVSNYGISLPNAILETAYGKSIVLKDVFDLEDFVSEYLFGRFKKSDSEKAPYTKASRQYAGAVSDYVYKRKGDIKGTLAKCFRGLIMANAVQDRDRYNLVYLSLQIPNIFNTNENKPIMDNEILKGSFVLGHFPDDDAYYYGLGQIISYLGDRGKGKDKTHTFLNQYVRQNSTQGLMTKVMELTCRYAHEVSKYFANYNKLIEMALRYCPSNGRIGDDNRLMLMLGYYSDNILYTKKQDDNEKQ